MSSKLIINCPYCCKTYKKRGCYENHIFNCERKHENVQKTPTTKELFDLIENLTFKYNNMQLELENVKSKLNVKYKKLNILNWLNENKKDINCNFLKIIEELQLNKDDLKIIFDKGFINGISEILNYRLSENENINCFNEKKGIIYVFNNKWEELQENVFENLIKNINGQMLTLFKKHQDDNIDKMEDEKFHEEIHKQLLKLLSDLPLDVKCRRIKNNLYEGLKRNFKTIVEFEVE